MAKSNLRTRAARALYEVTAEIRRNIDTGAWGPGHKLPTERDLELQYGIARNTLRKGLKHLESDGRIVRLVGRGSFVSKPGSSEKRPGNFLPQITGASPTEVMEVRLHLEPWAASLAARRANAADLRRLRDCIAMADNAATIKTFEDWDGQLHAAIISAAKNDLLGGLYDAVNMARRQPEWMRLKERTVTRERRRVYQRQHCALVDALCERDPERASRAMREHLLDVRSDLLGQP